jgi:hypothetical protein
MRFRKSQSFTARKFNMRGGARQVAVLTAKGYCYKERRSDIVDARECAKVHRQNNQYAQVVAVAIEARRCMDYRYEIWVKPKNGIK